MMTEPETRAKLKFYDDFMTALVARIEADLTTPELDRRELKRVLQLVKKVLKALDKA